MDTTHYTPITDDDVIEFSRLLKERDKKMTPQEARASLIRSGVYDAQGKPRWPTTTSGKRKRGETLKRKHG